MYSRIIIITCLISLFCTTASLSQTKVSPFVRQAVMNEHLRAVQIRKAKGRDAANAIRPRTITAFVRTSDTDLLRSNGCSIYAQWDDIVIASIPLDKVMTLARMPQVKQIEAGKSCSVTNDTIATITRTRDLWSQTLSNSSTTLTGKGVVVGVMDISFDLTHPTFYSSDGQTYRIKQLWDMLDNTDQGSAVTGRDTIYVGRQYIGTESLLNKRHSLDGMLNYHGTHTAGTAAGSGWEGSTQLSNTYSGMAPDADICLVANVTGKNVSLIPEEDLYKYTTATDMLGFKYIFDYAESVGKPCVINFSEGAYDDLYQSGIYGEVLSKMVGPGRILCSSAGNQGNGDGTYFHKTIGEDRKGAFLSPGSSNYAYYVLRSSKPVDMLLTFYQDGEKKKEWAYSTAELSNYPDSILQDTIIVGNDSIELLMEVYPSCFDSTLYATDLLLEDISNNDFGSATPVSLVLKGEDNDIEAFCAGGYFVRNKLDPSLSDFDCTHNVFFPGSSHDVICVGNSAYRTTFRNYADQWRVPFPAEDTGGVISRYSSIGPSITGEIKPDVVAPGMNVISAYNSFYREEKPDAFVYDDVRNFTYNGRQYQWHALSGTSMSSPAVAGIIALWLQVCPTLTPDQIRDVFAHSCTHYDESLSYPNNTYGYGEIDALAGLEYIKQVYTGIVEVENGRRGTEGKFVYTLDGRMVNCANGKHGIFIYSDGSRAIKVVQ